MRYCNKDQCFRYVYREVYFVQGHVIPAIEESFLVTQIVSQRVKLLRSPYVLATIWLTEYNSGISKQHLFEK